MKKDAPERRKKEGTDDRQGQLLMVLELG